jgi:hypothetical protein
MVVSYFIVPLLFKFVIIAGQSRYVWGEQRSKVIEEYFIDHLLRNRMPVKKEIVRFINTHKLQCDTSIEYWLEIDTY